MATIEEFCSIESEEDKILEKKRSLLRKSGWQEVCATPGSYWIWRKTFMEYGVLCRNLGQALEYERHYTLLQTE